jgi:hypothetical protein
VRAIGEHVKTYSEGNAGEHSGVENGRSHLLGKMLSALYSSSLYTFFQVKWVENRTAFNPYPPAGIAHKSLTPFAKCPTTSPRIRFHVFSIS